MSTFLTGIVGVCLALATAAMAALLRFEKRTFYSTIMIVIASYYVLFAIVGGASRVLPLDTFIATMFVVLVVLGARYDTRLIAAALVLHGVLDVVHGNLVSHAGVPAWWPPFCLAYDVTAGLLLARSHQGRGLTRPA